jgi:hypothetical protein
MWTRIQRAGTTSQRYLGSPGLLLILLCTPPVLLGKQCAGSQKWSFEARLLAVQFKRSNTIQIIEL